MSTREEYENWLKGNGDYLTNAVTWVRLKLELLTAQYAVIPNAPEMPMPVQVQRPRSWWEKTFNPAPSLQPSTAPVSTATSTASNRNLEAELQAAFNAMQQSEQSLKPAPMLNQITQLMNLNPFERNLLLLCYAMEAHPQVPALCARAQDNPARPYPTFALAFTLFKDHSNWNALAADQPLRYFRLLEINQSPTQPLTASALRADERIVAAIKGLDTLDDRLAALFTPIPWPDPNGTLPPSQQLAVAQTTDGINQARQHPIPIMQLIGPDLTSQQLVAQHVARALNAPLYRLPLEHLPSNLNELETLTRLWQRESLLARIVLLIETHDTNDKPETAGHLRRFLERGDGMVLVATREPLPQLERFSHSIEVNPPTTLEQRIAWQDALGTHHTQTATQLAAQFSLGTQQIASIGRSLAPLTAEEQAETAWNASRAVTRPRLDALAKRLNVKARKDQLVLPPEQSRILEQISAQVRARGQVYEDWGFAERMNRGLGINALFAGESGTGKTMAAEVIANELNLDLYRIDLSSVVNKYIGETEKNLRKIFDAAEQGGAILFFDEADALFGKRSEVKDSHDRYANIEVNYLLQRMESFSGLAILATNQKSAMDNAFIRRLRFIITFPFPGVPERKRLWTNVFPNSTPLENLEIDRLARFDLTGASIHNAALNAAFLAASQNSTVNMTHMLEAIRSEYRKMDRPINEIEFRPPVTAPLVVTA
jgi:ATPase family associated with various cellular activities (AAA)